MKSKKELVFDTNALEDLQYWIKNDRKRASKIIHLIQEVQSTPFSGSGKPEPLKYTLSGCWSRRIDQEHRLVYQVLDKKIKILACRYHY